jgi:hypothetical protein
MLPLKKIMDQEPSNFCNQQLSHIDEILHVYNAIMAAQYPLCAKASSAIDQEDN